MQRGQLLSDIQDWQYAVVPIYLWNDTLHKYIWNWKCIAKDINHS